MSAVLGVEDPGPLLDVVQRGRVVGEDDDLVGGFEGQQRHCAAGAADGNHVPLGDENRGQVICERARGEEVRLKDVAVLTVEHRLVQDFQHVYGAGNDVGAPLH